MLKVMDIPERIETKRLVLLRLQLTDAEEMFYTYSSKPASTRFVVWPMHQSVHDARAYLARTRVGWDQGIDFSFSIRLKDTNRLLGACGFLIDNGNAQIGYVLGPVHWLQGYATEACNALVALLKVQPWVKSITSFVDAENAASVRVLQKCGFAVATLVKDFYRFPNQQNRCKDCWVFCYAEATEGSSSRNEIDSLKAASR
ncbi:MAG: GNAT family N-acetyltransferase [Cytophagales bacterium]|nr:GNAT family N-acetyltransferase [Cytophagales bacterium]